MARTLCGIETEYALALLNKNGSRTRAELFLDTAKKVLPNLYQRDAGGLFLENGSRLYLDCGHPELSTCECCDPYQAVRYVKAGDRLMSRVCEAIKRDCVSVSEVMCSKCNVDYSNPGATWGSHESYLYRNECLDFVRDLTPHLVSRIILTGAGGFQVNSQGLVFTISPRSLHFRRPVSEESTSMRGIIHTKDEHLSGHGYRRCHILCGESLCSELSWLLRIGTTALVITMLDEGIVTPPEIRPNFPVKALHTFALDPQLKACVRSVNNKQITALEIQSAYLKKAEQNLGKPFMPPWAEKVCAEWRRALDLLAEDPQALSRTLDWRIKYELYEHRVKRRGFSWAELDAWTSMLRKYKRLLRPSALSYEEYEEFGGDLEDLELDYIPKDTDLKSVKGRSFMEENGVDPGRLDEFLELRAELFEIDTRFGQLGEKGIFSALDRKGVLDHRVEEVGDITDAIFNPPSEGRAKLRGKWVKRLCGYPDRGTADWAGVSDRGKDRVLDLSDPFETKERWVDL